MAPVPDLSGGAGPDLLAGQVASFGDPRESGYVYRIAGDTGAIRFVLASPPGLESAGFGQSVSQVGDVDGDGQTDLAVGAPEVYNGSGATTRPGYVHVFSGATGALLRSVESLGEKPCGATYGDAYGTTLLYVDDVDGDGPRELAVAAPQTSCSAGPERVDIVDIQTGERRFVLLPPGGGSGSGFGQALALLDDLDGDGVREIAVGAPFANRGPIPNYAGQVHVFSGATGALRFTLQSPAPEKYGIFGAAVALTDDRDGDGTRDLFVGAPGDEPGGNPDEIGVGQVYLFSGATGAWLRTYASPLTYLYGSFGQTLAADRDLDGDAVADLVAGIDTESTYGTVYAVSGATGQTLFSLVSPTPDAYGWLGREALVVRDFTGDGVADIATVAQSENTAFGYGRVHVFGGRQVVADAPGAGSEAGLQLDLPAPSPSRGRTALALRLRDAGPARLAVYDVLGREVARPVDRWAAAGRHMAVVDVSAWPAGVYVVRLTSGPHTATQRLVVAR